MIKKLRRKFILTNMLLVSLVLLAVFLVLLGFNYRKLAEQSEASMRMALLWNTEGPPRFEFGPAIQREPDFPVNQFPQDVVRRGSMVPVFVVSLDQDGSVKSVTGGGNVSVSQEVAEQAVAAVAADSGSIPTLDLRYLRETGRDGSVRIAFADKSWERSSLLPLLWSSLLVGGSALVFFFLISLFLSGLALKPAGQAWEQQRRFVADASHELKTPLTIILANTDILLSHPADTIKERSKWLEYTRDEALRMKGLVEDMLFLAKHDAALVPVLAPSLDLSDLVQSSCLGFESVAFESGVTLESHIAPGLQIAGDPNSLRRLVGTLLDNACKYAEGERLVTVSLAREGEHAVFSVSNSGAPIPSEHLEHLFDRFYRSDNARSRQDGGYGLGLAIAKSIAENHKGTIAVTSGNEGTRFTLTLPLAG